MSAAATEESESLGRTAVVVAWDGAARGVLAVSDTVKPSSSAAVALMKQLGLSPILLTGDNERAARAVAAEVGIEEVRAEVLPAGKADVVAGLQQQGRVVAMVGDGVNDAVALATSDLGIAMGEGSEAARRVSGLVLQNNRFALLPETLEEGRTILRNLRRFAPPPLRE